MMHYKERGILCMLCWIDAGQPFFLSSFLTTYTKHNIHTHYTIAKETALLGGGGEGLRIQGILRNEIPTTTTTTTTPPRRLRRGRHTFLGGGGGHICFLYFVDGNQNTPATTTTNPTDRGFARFDSIRYCVRTRQPTTTRLDMETMTGVATYSAAARLIFFLFVSCSRCF